MLYLLFVPSTFLLLIMLIDLRKTTKHDKVLFRFCQIRRDIMHLISVEADKINKPDYQVIRLLLDVTSATIHEFNHFKSTAFNLRWFIAWLKKYKKNAVAIDKLETSHININKIKEKSRVAMVAAFLSYTPFIKSQLIVMLVLYISWLLLKLGVKSLHLESLLNYLSWLKDDIKNHSDHTPQHA